MNHSLAALALTALLAGCAGGGAAVPPAGPASSASAAQRATEALTATAGERLNAVPGLPSSGTIGERLGAVAGTPTLLCGKPVADSLGCHLQQRVGLLPQPDPNTPYARIAGYKPDDLAAAYGIPRGLGAGRTVAVVDAFDDPAAENDLAVYRKAMGLPPCTAAGGCFAKVAAYNGNAAKADAGWAAEAALDAEMVSAICPLCRIVLVEAKSDKLKDLAAAEEVAAAYAPDAISNSFYAPEDPKELAYAGSFDQPGIAITAAAGDGGYGANFPASLPGVVAVGATSLLPDISPRGWSEAAWSGSGSGCSALAARPAWQTDGGCASRAVADVAAVGDPRTGVAMYTSIAAPGQTTGWLVAGGTSVGAPLVAALYALAGNANAIVAPERLWQTRSGLFSVPPGVNGTYGGPAGNGTPNGLAAF